MHEDAVQLIFMTIPIFIVVCVLAFGAAALTLFRFSMSRRGHKHLQLRTRYVSKLSSLDILSRSPNSGGETYRHHSLFGTWLPSILGHLRPPSMTVARAGRGSTSGMRSSSRYRV